MKPRLIQFFIIPVLLLAACSNGNNPDIIEVLDRRENAFESQDHELYESLISENYSANEEGKVINRDEIVKKFRSNTTPFDNIEMEHSERVIEVSDEGNTANAVQMTVANLRIDNEASVYKTREIITLRREKGEWKIIKESKIDLFRGFVFGSG